MAQSIFENMIVFLPKPRAKNLRADDVNPGTAPQGTVWRKIVVNNELRTPKGLFLWLMV